MITYFDNGNIASEGNYKMDQKEGKWVWYYKNGQIRQEGHFVNGLKRVNFSGIMRRVNLSKKMYTIKIKTLVS